MPPTVAPRSALAKVPSWVALAAFLGAVLMLAHATIERRASGAHATAEHWAMTDFRDTLYYPAVALMAGSNPWGARFAEDHPVQRPLPPYGPVVALVHLPLALLPVRAAEAVYFLVTIGATVAVAALSLGVAGHRSPRSVLALATAMLLSRPGRQNLLLGQCTLEVVLGCYLALLYGRDRPGLAALGIVVASMKPQFAMPVTLCLLARGDVRAVSAGVAATALLSLGVLFGAGGLDGPRSWLAAIGASSTTVADAALLWPRIDVGFLARHVLALPHHADLVAGALALVVGLVALRRASADGTAAPPGIAAALACLTVLLPLYHIAYDALLLTLPIVLLVAARPTAAWRGHAALATLLVALLLVPAVNFVATQTVVAHVTPHGMAWRAITGSNALALTAALGLAAWLANRASLTGGGGRP